MRKSLLSLSAITLVVLAGCGKKDETPAAAAPAASAPVAMASAPATDSSVIKIGHVGPTSGGIAHLGKDNENGVRLAIEEANAKGLTIGG